MRSKVVSLAILVGIGIISCAAKPANYVRGWSDRNESGIVDASIPACVESCPIPGLDGGTSTNTQSPEPRKADTAIEAKIEKKNCPDGMVFVDVNYCPNPLFDRPQYDETGTGDIQCDTWMEKPCNLGGIRPSCMFARCKKYKTNSTVCPVSTIHKMFCIDKYEYTKHNETLPLTMITYYQAKKICEADNKRLCKETEWEAACMTNDNLPYGVVNGLERPNGICNIDVEKDLVDYKIGRIRKDLLVPSGSMKDCHNSLGIYSLNGNSDEITMRDRSPAPRSPKEIGKFSMALKGGWMGPVRNRCRPSTTAHSNDYYNTITSFRCCADKSQ
jgi:sulfatase modifying factor 1